ncbi:MAG TPA: hybrid sensor histidine kinase/response regulator [Gemmatimonas aurantiaca]|uniref:histidine kinase n=2 Tax=Gemmatimonas aurantiaca TaxID=173480 RepID=C1A5Q1_GEMAT|nr:hybrid sensor histidine kinase/response regulator [Gemmatimonas aurantiaca]BAH37561.1 putative two-component hybrid sensor and regulator [Gemmatimonas aurantiaca T-27]HCT58593.1 hybrid sensor histidine kinase/response regulator [Gemmatimonas aurantiaca]
MSIELILAVIGVALQFTTMAAAWTLGGAARWRRARWFTAVTLTAGMYCVVDVVGALQIMQGMNHDWTMGTNLVLATVHAATWLIFAFVDNAGRWQSVPLAVRSISIAAVAVNLTLVTTGLAHVLEPVRVAYIPMLQASVRRPELNALGQAAGALALLMFAGSAYGFLRRVRIGERGAGAILLGFGLFLLFTLEELAVASGWIDFIYLADLGYFSVVAPVAWQMLSGFRDDANELDQLSTHLTDEVRRRTEERDDARRVMLEQQRLASLGRLAAGVGHEINNPLQYLRFNLEELRDHPALRDDEEGRVAVDQAFEGVDRIRQVVDGLRTYVRPGADELVPLDIRDVARAALRVAAPQWRQGITVSTELADVPLVNGHEGRLVQVALNPIVNGAQAMLAHADATRKTLTVVTRTGADGWAEILVRDQGPGFAPEVTARLGEPYVTTKAATGGTGLGLFVARGIVEAHGGTVTFANLPEGGASVLVRLPPVKVPRQGVGERRTPQSFPVLPKTTTPLRVLVVEDDPSALHAIERGLVREGLEVTSYSRARDALAWLADAEVARRVDLVVTDLMMPDVSGSQFAAALATAHPRLRERLVVLTGGAAAPEEEAFLHEPGLLVLGKPITRQELAAQLRARVVAPTKGSRA